jgi:hypothetical protein
VEFTIPLKSPISPGPVDLVSKLSFKESGSPDPGRVSTIEPIKDTIDVTATGATAASAVPTATAVQLSITKSGQAGKANVPASSGTTAAITFTPTVPFEFECPPQEVCRVGDWIAATIPGLFAKPWLQFNLYWPPGAVPSKQSVDNFAIFYQPDVGNLEIVKTKCNEALTNPPCVKDIKEVKQGGKSAWYATFVNNENGYMK